MVLKGSVVSVYTSFLYCDHYDLITMMAYNIRPKIYGVVNRTYSSGAVSVTWSIDGLLNIEEDDVRDNFHSPYDMSVLEIVRDSTDILIGQDTYLATFFEHNGNEWKTKCIMPDDCDFCEGAPRTIYPPHMYDCKRMNYRSQLPLMQLYFDLSLEVNNHMTNKQKRFQCYRFYTRLVYRRLGAGVRRRVCPCVQQEISLNFPTAEGEDRVGFRE